MWPKRALAPPAEAMHGALWDPRLEFGTELYWIALHAIRAQTLEAFAALRDLTGAPAFTSEDLELCLFEYRVIASLIRESRSRREDKEFLLQVCASLMFKNGMGIRRHDAVSFFSLLTADLTAFERAAARKRGGNRIRLAVQRLLEGYGLGGRRNRDILLAIERNIAQPVAVARTHLGQGTTENRRGDVVLFQPVEGEPRFESPLSECQYQH